MRSSWLMVALVASLGLNLALAGFVAGRLSQPGPAPAAMDPSLGMFRVLRGLPEPRREALRPMVRDHMRELRGALRDMRRAQGRINGALAAEPLDPTALAEALAGFRQTLLSSQELNHALLVRLSERLTREERRLLIDAMSRGQRRAPQTGNQAPHRDTGGPGEPPRPGATR